MKNQNQNSMKCEFCEQKFNQEQLTEKFNRIYNHLCPKCKSYLENRGIITDKCSKYCFETGMCDESCNKR